MIIVAVVVAATSTSVILRLRTSNGASSAEVVDESLQFKFLQVPDSYTADPRIISVDLRSGLFTNWIRYSADESFTSIGGVVWDQFVATYLPRLSAIPARLRTQE